VGNFRVEPPGLFRGRGEHPKMGRIKRRIYPKDIVINIGKGVPVPKHPFPDQHWKMVRQPLLANPNLHPARAGLPTDAPV
jgi:DNA topoisomerase I